jgi:protein kinase-like protein/PEGA domain-containing protein
MARGGMGALYLAHDPDLDREVAIKVMSESIMRDEQARARFYREARAAARLQHRNIVTVFDFAHDGEIPYFVMELLRGQNLSQRLQHGPPLTMPMKLDLAFQLCQGLHFAHGEGVIHRDVKPANIWLLEDGGVKLLDFGIAKSVTGTHTLGSSVVGSAGYMSPEHIEGQPVDHRSDLFSVGAVLFELIAGKPPFEGDSVTSVMMKIVQDEPAPDIRILAPDTPAELASVISRALEKDPDRRYADAAHMAADLRAVKLEITEHEEQADGATLTEAFDGRTTRSRSMASDAAPTFPPTLVVPHRSQSSPEIHAAAGDVRVEAAAVDDYVLRPPEEILSPALRPEGEQTTSHAKGRWIAVAAAAVMVAVVAVAIFMMAPRFLVRDGGPLQFRFTSTPEGARIFVSGVDTGLRTPADVQVTQLPASVRLELAGFEPFATDITEQNAKEANRSINANMVKLPAPSPPPVPAPAAPAPAAPAPAAPAPVAPAPRPLAELKVLRAPGPYAFCTAAIGRSWTGYPFDGVTSIRLPAQRYPIRIECSGQAPILGEIEVPAGKNERNFNEVVTLNEVPREAPVQR